MTTYHSASRARQVPAAVAISRLYSRSFFSWGPFHRGRWSAIVFSCSMEDKKCNGTCWLAA